MIIKRIKSSNFGKFKNFDIALSKGINIIYGENEAGKSTLQAFIKVMLYGMNSQKKTIRDNERKKYMPWSGERASGELVIEDDSNNEFVINRSFGATKKDDESEVYHFISGSSAVFSDKLSPGEELLGIREEAFEKTAFIRQLGTEVMRDKDDEIMRKLLNLEQSGDENISFHKAVNLLEEARRTVIGIRKKGKLDDLKLSYEEYINEKRALEELQLKSVEDVIDLNKLKDNKENLIAYINLLEEQREHFRSEKLIKDHKQIKSYMSEIEECKAELKALEEKLKYNNTLINDTYIEYLKDQITVLNTQKDKVTTLNIEKLMLENQIEEISRRVERYQGYEKLDDNIEEKVISLSTERNNIETRLREYEQYETELKDLENQLDEEMNLFPFYKYTDSSFEEKCIEIFKKQEELNELKLLLQNNSQKDNLLLRAELLKNKKKSYLYALIFGVFLAATGVVLSLQKGLYLATISITGIGLIIYSIFKGNSTAKMYFDIKEIMNGSKDYEKLELKIGELSRELKDEYDYFGANDYAGFVSWIVNYKEHVKDIEILHSKISEKKLQIERLKPEELRTSIERNNRYLQFVFDHCNVVSSEELFQRLKDYRDLISEKTNSEKELLRIKSSEKACEKEIIQCETGLIDKLKNFSFLEDLKDFEQSVKFLTKLLSKRLEIINRIDTLDSTCKALLRGSKYEELDIQISKLKTVTNIHQQEPCCFSEAEFDKLIKEKNSELIQIERMQKDKENALETRFLNKKNLVQIEESIIEIKEKIHHYEEVLKIIDIAAKVLREAFSEVQKSFGPKLNKIVGEILYKISDGKYDDLRISEEYEIKITDPQWGKIKEIDYLSNGTWDQIYFALRMGIIHLIFGETKAVPIILDDAFVQYDDKRLKKVLEFLIELSSKKQIILFTCQKREVEFLENYEGANVINL